MEESCLFCLEPMRDNPTVNPPGCSCKIFAHEACIHAWYIQKQTLECPICHTVVVQTTIPLLEPNEESEQREMYTRQQKVAAGCCCLIMAWVTSLSILEYIFAQ